MSSFSARPTRTSVTSLHARPLPGQMFYSALRVPLIERDFEPSTPSEERAKSSELVKGPTPERRGIGFQQKPLRLNAPVCVGFSGERDVLNPFVGADLKERS